MQRNTIIVIVILLAASFVHAADPNNPNSITVSRIVRVIDGDTFSCDIDHWPAIIGKDIRVRIAMIDCPELREPNGTKAKRFVEKNLRKAKNIVLKNIKRGKYFRIVADVYVDGNDISILLGKAGFAKLVNEPTVRPEQNKELAILRERYLKYVRNQSAKKQTEPLPKPEQKKQSTEDIANEMLATGAIHSVDITNRIVRIDPLIWHRLLIDQKQGLVLFWSNYMKIKTDYEWVDILSNRNDTKLAKYSVWSGVKIYE